MHNKEDRTISHISNLCSPELFGDLATNRLHLKPPDFGVMMPKEKKKQSPSDFDLNPSPILGNSQPKVSIEAAVLIPIIKHKELSVLLTRRTDDLPTHAGQISFPGGKNDPTDEDPIATALREAKEEIGLNRAHVAPLGFLDIYHTVTGYAVTPVVAFLDAGCSLVPNHREVSEILQVPLAFLMNPKNLEVHSRDFMGGTRYFYAFSYKNYYIWGATAGILKNMYEKIFRP